MRRSSSIGSGSSFLIVFFVLTITFSLISAGIFKANTTIDIAAYAKKSKDSSDVGSKGDGSSSSSGSDGGSSEGGSSSGGSNDGGTAGGGGGSSDQGGDNSGSTGEDNNNNPTTDETSPPPPPSTCEQGSTSPECSNVPEPPPPPPPGPIDCAASPNDPSCKTTLGPIDCNTNPNDPSCGPQPPVDCKTNPDDPSCTTPPPVDCKANPSDASCTTQPVDCTATPDDPSCKVDCTKNPDDPSCKVDCTKNPDDPSCKVDCTKNPDDPSCKVDCTKNPDDPSCKVDCTKNPDDPRCPQCPPVGLGMSCPPPPPPPPCQKWQHFDPKLNKCVPPCPPGYYLKNGVCVKGPITICPPGFHLEKGVCTRTIVKHVTTVETVVRNFITNQPKFLLLLDTAQLCQLAGDTQCVAKQNQFDTLNLVTKLDATGKTWTITGQVENRVSKIQRNVQITAYFYDSKGNNVGGPYKGTINPTVLKSLQLGVFNMKPSTSIMNGTPTFLRLEYQSTTS
jgi:hypothetical protein